MHRHKKNDVSIRLTESAVFLRTDDSSGRGHAPEPRPSLLRGLLILELAKPTKITSIELKLQALSATSWPEGFGARRADITENNKVYSVSSVLFNAETTQRRTASVGPGSANHDFFDEEDGRMYVPRARSRGAVREIDSARSSRRTSIDLSVRNDDGSPEIPPYSFHPPPSHTPEWTLPGQNLTPGHLETVDEYPGLPSTSSEASTRSPPHTPHVHSSASSIRSFRGDRSLSQHVSVEDAYYYDTPSVPSTAQHSPQLSPKIAPGELSRSPSESRGRRGNSRFSLTSVSNVLLDAVRSNSPRSLNFNKSKEREPSTEDPFSRRGRTLVKGLSNEPGQNSLAGQKSSKERLSTKLSDILRSEPEEHKTEGHGWREFKPGTYTYPISFTIPANAPPTLQTTYGSVTWTLSAVVHRQGAFTSRLEAQREVIVVSCPTEEDTEDTENIIVERHWDSQLQYLFTVSGRTFYIGGTMPITMTFMPLTKVKIHRLTILIEEKTEYLTHFKRVVRTEPLNQVNLLSIRHEGRNAGHILPLESDDKEAFELSPLRVLAKSEEDVSEMASSFMGPGPWTFQQDLKLSNSCRALHFTNKNKQSNMVVSHTLKFVIRVESGDATAIDPKTGKKKLFDIMIHTPVHILSCRCNPEWTNLPHYTKTFEDPDAVAHQCPCLRNSPPGRSARPTLEQTATRHSTDSESGASMAESSPVDTTMPSLHEDSVIGRTHLYERLISGQEGISGEAPPAYHTVPL